MERGGLTRGGAVLGLRAKVVGGRARVGRSGRFGCLGEVLIGVVDVVGGGCNCRG